MKFGGTSLGSSSKIKEAANIVKSYLDSEPAIIVSAIGGITDMVIGAVEAASKGKVDLGDIRKKHEGIIGDLGLDSKILDDLDALEELLTSVKDVQINTKDMDSALSFGERLSSKIFAAYLEKEGVDAKALNAYDIGMVTNDEYGKAELLPQSFILLKDNLENLKEVPVITGFIAKCEQGFITTFGRGGSDYTAAIVGAALEADEIQIWTDVNGVMSSDPRIVKQAHTIDELSFTEAAELSYFGAKVLHPKTIQPAIDKNIPVIVRNTMDYKSKGTRIVQKVKESAEIVKAISCKKNVTIINIDSSRMLDAYGFLAKIFNVFDSHKVPVDMVATSEISVSLTVDTGQIADVVEDLQKFSDVKIHKDKAIVIVVGEGLKKRIGKAAGLFNILRENNIHIDMISQGASEINIGFVVDMKDADKAVKVLHKHYFP